MKELKRSKNLAWVLSAFSALFFLAALWMLICYNRIDAFTSDLLKSIIAISIIFFFVGLVIANHYKKQIINYWQVKQIDNAELALAIDKAEQRSEQEEIDEAKADSTYQEIFSGNRLYRI